MTDAPVVLLKLLDLKPFSNSKAYEDLAVLGGSILALVGGDDSARVELTRMIAGLEKPWSGIIRVGRRMISSEQRQSRRYIGFVPRFFQSPPGITPKTYLMLTAAGDGLGRKESENGVNELLRWCSLTSCARKPVEKLTDDQKYSTGFASALLHGPQLMVLEGPVPDCIFPRLVDISESGRAVVISVPGVEYIPPCVDRIALCDSGGIAAVVRQSDLADVCRRSIEIRVSFYPSLDRRIIENLPGARDLAAVDDGYRFMHGNTASAVAHLVNLARANGRSIVDLDIRSPSIARMLEYFSEKDEPVKADLLCMDNQES